MKKSEIVLPARSELKLWVPKDGFSDDFLREIAEACSGFSSLDEAYLVLVGEGATLLMALQMTEPVTNVKSASDMVAEVMEGLMPLFDASVQVDAICLNGRPGIRDSIAALTAPFYKRESAGSGTID